MQGAPPCLLIRMCPICRCAEHFLMQLHCAQFEAGAVQGQLSAAQRRWREVFPLPSSSGGTGVWDEQCAKPQPAQEQIFH